VATATFEGDDAKFGYFIALAQDSMDVQQVSIKGSHIVVTGNYLDCDFCRITAEHAGVVLVEFKTNSCNELSS